ncbi:hypothetical protein [Aquimarina sp. SS2-1]|uniref:hypothetical protein n=1 Tax=Aquimarina besae TaxID=3342247 RepID=UPI00366AF12E
MNNTTNKNMNNIYNFEEVDSILEENVRSNYPSICEGRSDSECAKMVVKVIVNVNQKSDALRIAGAPLGIYTANYEIIVNETCNLYSYHATHLFELDYTNCVTEEDQNKSALLSKIQERVKQSKTPELNIYKGEVGISNFKDTMTKSKRLYEQEYEIKWLEIK